MPAKLRVLALHGYGGTFGGPGRDVDILATLQSDVGEDLVEFEKLQAPHTVPPPCFAPPPGSCQPAAWISGNQAPLGKVVGFSQSDAAIAEGLNPPPLLSPESLPAISPSDDLWSGAEGFKASLDTLAWHWGSEGPYDGLIGFSQGGLMAALFLAKYLAETKEMGGDSSDLPRFAIFAGSFMRPWPEDASAFWPPKDPLPFPSLHFAGNRDTVVAACRSEELASRFARADIVRHDLEGYPPEHRGHVVPWGASAASRSGKASCPAAMDALKAFLQRMAQDKEADNANQLLHSKVNRSSR